MKIENKSVLGLYKYEESLQYERGDIVAHNGILYVVDKDVCGVDPSIDTAHAYYATYLGEDILQPSEFGDDKYAHKFVTARVLKEVLSNYMYNTKTYIRNIFTGDINDNGDVAIYELDGTISVYKDITLDDFFDKFKSGIWQINNGSCILRQSVFSISDPVQELFYPQKGILMYRTKSNKDWKTFNAVDVTTTSTTKLDDTCYYYQEDKFISSGTNIYTSFKSDYEVGSIVNILLSKTEDGTTTTKNIVVKLSNDPTTFKEFVVKLSSGNVKLTFNAGDWGEPIGLSRRIYYNAGGD